MEVVAMSVLANLTVNPFVNLSPAEKAARPAEAQKKNEPSKELPQGHQASGMLDRIREGYNSPPKIAEQKRQEALKTAREKFPDIDKVIPGFAKKNLYEINQAVDALKDVRGLEKKLAHAEGQLAKVKKKLGKVESEITKIASSGKQVSSELGRKHAKLIGQRDQLLVKIEGEKTSGDVKTPGLKGKLAAAKGHLKMCGGKI